MTQPTVKYLKDYQAPAYFVNTVDLRFELEEEQTRVYARLNLQRNPNITSPQPLVLSGEELILNKLILNNKVLSPVDYQLTPETLTIQNTPDAVILEIETTIYPQLNTSLTGLYQSNGIFCSQCEAEGFRRITYFPDRPDVMAKFTTKIIADKTLYPVLLSNGNLEQQGMVDDKRHFAVWVDPFKKPSYLFALVAGKLDQLNDHFMTQSGRRVELKVYVDPGFLDQSHYAMACIKRAMRWDEETFGREYDLDIYMVVAVADFNMGAMENKGLNIFNAKYVLAKPETATDTDYVAIESVIGHEYFHNWTGNRITCRDWFQLSLKEGLTIFRDQEFTADMTERKVKRIEDVQALRAEQFPQDAGPMAHSVRPDSYIEMNNFYTATVYNKGAEVIRMIKTIIGVQNFHKGMDLYFERHDGQAVTTEDFVCAMEAASGVDLTQFRRWYFQAGTPVVSVKRHYDPVTQIYQLTFSQTCASTPGQATKQPFQIPVAMALLNEQGHSSHQQVLLLTQPEQTFVFEKIAKEPVPSLLRNFSAPVKLKLDLTDEELLFLLKYDEDAFNRWEAGQTYALRVLLNLVAAIEKQNSLSLPPVFMDSFKYLLTDLDIDKSYLSLLLTLPSESYIAEQMAIAVPVAIHQARQFVKQECAKVLRTELLAGYKLYKEDSEFCVDTIKMRQRSFKNLCLNYLVQEQDPASITLCYQQFKAAITMTDSIAALQNLSHLSCPERELALADFYQRWQQDSLVINKWFAVQARTQRSDALTQVQNLVQHPAFKWTNPNNIRAVVGVFSRENLIHFHAQDGSGYLFLGDAICRLNDLNPQVAARLLEPFTHSRRYDQHRQELIQTQLKRILALPKLSKDVFEIAQKSLV